MLDDDESLVKYQADELQSSKGCYHLEKLPYISFIDPFGQCNPFILLD